MAQVNIIKLDYLIQFKLATKIFVKDTPTDAKKPMIDTKTFKFFPILTILVLVLAS